MCGGAVVLGRLALVAWAASDPKRGAHTVFGMFAHPGLNHRPAVLPGCGPAAALEELRAFFKTRRNGSAAGRERRPGSAGTEREAFGFGKA